MSTWQKIPGTTWHETRVLRDSYWAEVHQDGSWEVYGLTREKPVKKGFSGTATAAKKAVDKWEEENL